MYEIFIRQNIVILIERNGDYSLRLEIFISKFSSVRVIYNFNWYCNNLGREDRGTDYTVLATFLQGEKFITDMAVFRPQC